MTDPPVQVYALQNLLRRVEWLVVVILICLFCWALVVLAGYGVYELLT